MDLQKLREAQGITQTELAQKVGVSRQAISAMELKTIRPSVETAKKLAEILHCKWSDFFEDDSKI